MFSSFGVVKSFLKAKLNKVKKETKKVEKETEKELVKEAKMSPAEAKIKSKNVENVKKSNQKKAKLKLKIFLLDVLDVIWSIIKWFVGFLVGTFGLVGCCVILFVFVLMCLRFGLLKLDFFIPTGTITGTGTTQTDDCIQGGQVLTQGSLLDINIGSLSGTITPYQMNLLKTFQLVEEFLQADGVNKPYFDSMPMDVANKVYRGIPAVESSFYIFGTSDTSHDVLKDILDDYKDTSLTTNYDYWSSAPRSSDSSKSYIGPHQIGELASINYADYFKAWDGEAFIEEWTKKYPKPTDEKDHFWMPYSVAMSIMHTNMMGRYGTVDDGSNKFNDFKTYTYERMAHFGIEANKDDCYQYIRAFLALSCYLQGQGLSYLNYDTNQGGKARIDFFCALFAASSDVDSQRSFENYAVNLDGSMKNVYSAHGSFATSLYGAGIDKNAGYGGISALSTATLGATKAITLNGKVMEYPVLRYVYEKYKDDATMSDCWNHLTAVEGQFFTSYTYGFSCLLQGNHIVAELGLSLPIATGGSRDDCISNYPDVQVGEYKNTVGQPQGIWNAFGYTKTTMDLINEMQVGVPWGEVKGSNVTSAFITRVKNFIPYMGEAVHAEGGNPSCTKSGDAERVLTETKLKAPFYHQGTDSDERWGNIKSGTYYDESGSTSTFNGDGCHIYSTAYALSVIQGRLINPPETLVIGWFGGFWNGGMASDSHVETFAENMNLNAKIMTDDVVNGKKEVDEILDKNGVVIVYLTKPFSHGNCHWVCITERISEGGIDKYKIWTSTKISQMFQTYTFDELYSKKYCDNWIRMGITP